MKISTFSVLNDVQPLPNEWELVPFFAVAEETKKYYSGEGERPQMLSVSQYRGVEPKKFEDENQEPTREELDGYLWVTPGQLALNTMWLNHRGLAVSEIKGVISPAYRTYEFGNDVLPRFMHYLLRSDLYVAEYSRLAYGVRPNSLQVSREDFDHLPVILPSAHEQRAIAEFLDRKTAAIGELIDRKRRLIELLEEKRDAVINRAVTRGLDPDVPMEASGIPWIGEIPEHWETGRSAHFVNRLTSGPRGWSEYFADNGALFFVSGNIGDVLDLDFEEVQYVDPPENAEGRRTRLQKSDIALCITGAKTGSVAYLDRRFDEGFVNQHVALLSPDSEKIEPFFFAAVLWSYVGQEYFNLVQYGGTKEGLSLSDVGNCPIPLPPRDEQQRIAEEVQNIREQYRGLTSALRAQLEHLEEYRQSLITAAVTGQIDVEAEEVVKAKPDVALAN